MKQKATPRSAPHKLRLLTFNIQAGTPTSSFRNYVTSSWRQVLPNSQRVENLDAISDLVSTYDMVAMQEVDSGSLRSGYINQSRYIATHADLPYWFHQSNRRVGTMAYPGIGFLGRIEPMAVEEHRLPGAIPGRGALLLHFGAASELVVAVIHLALGLLSRRLQLEYLTELLQTWPNLVVMGDLNTQVDSRRMLEFRERLNLAAPTRDLASYPSWKPQRAIDHILVSRTLECSEATVIDVPYSDHLPVAATITLPDAPGFRGLTDTQTSYPGAHMPHRVD